MEKMPFVDQHVGIARVNTVMSIQSNWRQKLPVLTGRGVTLRELRVSDAPVLFAMLSTEEVSRFISPPPTSVEGFERFIAWTHSERAAGRYICFGIVPDGMNAAVGLFQVRQSAPGFESAEWGFALGSAYWGSGLFIAGAQLVLDFAFDVVGVHRMEARAAVQNGRGNGALRKIGALQEGILRRSLLLDGAYLAQVLWAILSSDRQSLRSPGSPSVH
jgi:ribosomal-protein-alanine N-acetyltransferase